jgi:aminoglycoside phosphotransferase (APT) family kinase protein
VHCTDESVIGAEFYVMERVKGIILRSELPPELGLGCRENRSLCKSFIDRSSSCTGSTTTPAAGRSGQA